MKVLVTGATGFVGKKLCELLFEKGHEVVALSRNPKRAKEHLSFARVFPWSPLHELISPKALRGVEAVVNLLGENIANKRWSSKQKQKILNSRVKSTQNLVQSLQAVPEIKCMVSSSAIGIYPPNTGSQLDEHSTLAGNFLAQVCKKWENAAKEATTVKRLVHLRTGVVLGPRGGALQKLVPIFQTGLGGPIGRGQMKMSWIGREDLCRLILFCLEENSLSGPVNAVAPQVATNLEFSKALARSLSRPCLFPVPPLALKVLFGEMSQLFLDSMDVSSQKAMDAGFQFQAKTVDDFFKDFREKL